jgi:hypothetical protein
MTKTTEQTVKVKVTKHPREMFYEGRSTRDHMTAQLNYLNTSPTIPDRKLIKSFVKKLKVGDIVGVEHNQYRVGEVTKETFSGVDIKTNEEFAMDDDRFTMAIGMGFAEILYRNGKPYGIDLEKEVKIKIIDNQVSGSSKQP